MKRSILTILAVLTAARIFPQQLRYATTKQDSLLAVKIISSLDPEESTSQLMLKAGGMLMGQPYVAGTLEGPDNETTCICLTRTDCILFVETCLDLARTARSRGDFRDFALMVQQSRYRHGQPSDYMERLHYTTEWIRHNEARGILKDVTLECGGKVYAHPINYMSTHPDSYPKLGISITQIEADLNKSPFTYIPKSDVSDARLLPGDIICFVTTIEGLDIQHVAIHIGNGRFMHASTSLEKVAIDKRTVSGYCNSSRSIAGIKVVRATDAFVPGDKVPAGQADDTFFNDRPVPDHIFSLMQGRSMRSGCTVSRDELRYLTVLHKDIEGAVHVGELIVHRDISKDVLDIFRKLYSLSYPIEKIRLIDYYDGNDELSMTDNNSSAFNWRTVRNTGKPSRHGMGMAIDINPLYNPCCQSNGNVQPAASRRYADRTAATPYGIVKGDACHRLFLENGFKWGGSWKSVKDYQHFEK